MLGIFKDRAALNASIDADGFVSGVVSTEIGMFVDNDLEGVLDELTELLIGTISGQDIDYKILGVDPDGLTLSVLVSLQLNDEDDEDEENDEE